MARKPQAAAPKIWRPEPPADVLRTLGATHFAPAIELEEWARSTFIEDGSLLQNEEHKHLQMASIGMLWTCVPNGRHMNRIVGQAEIGAPRAMGKWAKARAEQQLTEWFGTIPDFVITIDAHYAVQCEDAEFCSLLEHELGHCGQVKDEYGQPKFTKWGSPVFGMRGHCVEEFVFIVQRYGVGAAAGATRALVEAANRPPLIAPANIAQACGTCLARAA